jgi:hypothetical protein
MTLSLNIELIKRHDLEVGSFYFYKNHIVAEVKEGVAFTYEKAFRILELGKAYYGNKTPFVYISNRVNSYSFNPTAHYKTQAMFPNLKGYAVVTYDEVNQEIAELEQTFLNKPVAIFHNLEHALKWVEELILMD